MCMLRETLKNILWGTEAAWEERSVTNFSVPDVELQKKLAHL